MFGSKKKKIDENDKDVGNYKRDFKILNLAPIHIYATAGSSFFKENISDFVNSYYI